MRELEIIRYIQGQITAPGGDSLGIGDDCCVWNSDGPQCLSTDTILAGSHFTEHDQPALIGRKAAAAALSDLAAMGAVPVGASLSYQFAEHWDHRSILDGFIQELKRHNCPLLGGDTVRSNCLGLSVTVWGAHSTGKRFVQRSGAGVADVLVVTGQLGGSLARGRHLTPEPRILEGQWLAQQSYVHAMIDISDGLAADLPRLAAASECGCLLIANKLPVHKDIPQNVQRIQSAIGDGEDFELLFAIEARSWPELYQNWPFDVQISMVGMLTDVLGEYLLEDEYGRMAALPSVGFEH